MNILNLKDAYVCRETVYTMIDDALPVGELYKELIICLRQDKTARRPHTGGVDRCGQPPLDTSCSGLMKPDTHLGENARQIEVSDDQTTPFLFC
jgi:hypothetical protein